VTYWVDNSITVTLHEVAALSELLGNSLASGANSVQSVTYTVSDPSAALEPARKEALADAQRQAEQLASASGMSLGPIVTVSESSGGGAPGLKALGAVEAPAAGGVPTTPGTLEFAVQCSDLRPKDSHAHTQFSILLLSGVLLAGCAARSRPSERSPCPAWEVQVTPDLVSALEFKPDADDRGCRRTTRSLQPSSRRRCCVG
jgi:hypothetical protein